MIIIFPISYFILIWGNTKTPGGQTWGEINDTKTPFFITKPVNFTKTPLLSLKRPFISEKLKGEGTIRVKEI